MTCVYHDEAGVERPMVMGCYGIGITRTIAAVIEQNYGADGIIWPWPVAPYPRAPGQPGLRQARDFSGRESDRIRSRGRGIRSPA